MILRKLALICAFAMGVGTAQAATLSSVLVTPMGDTMNSLGTLVVTPAGFGFTGSGGTTSADPAGSYFISINPPGPAVPPTIPASPGTFSAVDTAVLGLTGNLIDFADGTVGGVSVIFALYSTTGGSLAADFGDLFRATISSPANPGGMLLNSGFVFDAGASILVEEVYEEAVIPLPAAGWLLLVGVAGLGAMRRRGSAT